VSVSFAVNRGTNLLPAEPNRRVFTRNTTVTSIGNLKLQIYVTNVCIGALPWRRRSGEERESV